MSLKEFVPRSATLYHELFHLVIGSKDTPNATYEWTSQQQLLADPTGFTARLDDQDLEELREFETSPSAQLYREGLQREEIAPLASHETIYNWSRWFGVLQLSFVQLLWVYFPAPVDDARKAKIESLKGVYPAVLGPGVPRSEHRIAHFPTRQWATETETLHGQQVQLLLWPHFWSNEKKAEWRHEPYAQPKFIGKLEQFYPVEWREEIYPRFFRIPRIFPR
ncbi:hypothetical protein BJY04DRAFT_216228 [Aspergillus karnatakaensis]|uniref:uncharacterized protein n=1 Tax=Aspergillus karnatakaensis TaxID=1810916 RepID=UPI003CCD7049